MPTPSRRLRSNTIEVKLPSYPARTTLARARRGLLSFCACSPFCMLFACAEDRSSETASRARAGPSEASGGGVGAASGALPGPDQASGASPGRDGKPGLERPTDAGASRADAGIFPAALLGVCWNPVGAGGLHPGDLDYAGFAGVDIPRFVELGVNVVRTYEPLLDREVLDQLWAAGIQVINSIYPYGGADPGVVSERVRAVADHPAILFWSLGNEWNYNGLYVDLDHAESLARINEAARLVKAEDPTHPVATIYGELPSLETIGNMVDIDVWGINAYRGLGFGDLFDRWRELSDKPMFVAEYGADAYNANLPGYDPGSQALATAALAREILEQTTRPGGARVLGGTIFEWADEWWKDAAGSSSAQDVGGIAPGGGPYPDQTFNEEWWGLVDIERAPRPAFESLRAVFAEHRAR